MKDPSKYVRQMYVEGLGSICTIYDGMAPAGATGKFAVITNTSFNRQGIKGDNYAPFTVTVEIYEEFKEYGNSQGVDDVADQYLEKLMPLKRSDYMTIPGFAQNEARLENVSNDAFDTGAALVTFRKTLTIVHLISEH